jgi:hypothetical protein
LVAELHDFSEVHTAPLQFTAQFSLEEGQELALPHALAVLAHVHRIAAPDGLRHSGVNQRIHAAEASRLQTQQQQQQQQLDSKKLL